MRWKHCPELKRKLNSKSRWWGQASGVGCVASSWRGSSRIFFSFFLRMVLVPRGSAGSLGAVHSAFFGSAWYVLFTLVWWIQGTIPATLTAVGVVRITWGPFHQGASKSCFQSLTHTWSPSVNSWICTNLVTRFITLPNSICWEIPLPEANLLTPVLLWEGASHSQFRMENSLGTVGSSWVWAEPSEVSPPRSSQSL